MLEAALDVMNDHGCVIACGHISVYNSQEPYGIRNMIQVIVKRITIRGFAVSDFEKEEGANFRREVSEHLLKGDIVYKEDIIEGLDGAPEALSACSVGSSLEKSSS